MRDGDGAGRRLDERHDVDFIEQHQPASPNAVCVQELVCVDGAREARDEEGREGELPPARLAIADQLPGACHVELEKCVHHVAAAPDLERIDDVASRPRELPHLERGSAHGARMPQRRHAEVWTGRRVGQRSGTATETTEWADVAASPPQKLVKVSDRDADLEADAAVVKRARSDEAVHGRSTHLELRGHFGRGQPRFPGPWRAAPPARQTASLRM